MSSTEPAAPTWPGAAVQTRQRAWTAIGAAALVAGSLGISIGALGPSLPLLHTHLGVALDSLGLLFTASFGGSVAATLVAGPLLDRRPARPLMVAGVAFIVAGQILLPLATTLPQALAAQLCTGLGIGTTNLGGAVLAARFFGQQSGRALALINMSFGMGAFVGPLVAAAVLEAAHDYRPTFIGIAVSLLPPLLIYTVLPLANPPGPHRQAGPGQRLPRSGLLAIILLAAVSSLYLGTEIGFGGWVFTYVRRTSSADITAASWVAAAYWLALSAGSLGAAVRPRRVQADWLILICAAGATLATVAVLGGRGNPLLELLASLTLGLFLGPIYPLTLANAAGIAPAAAGRVGALVIAVSQGGGGVLPWVQGLLFARGPAWGMSMTTVVCLAMTVLQLAYIRARTASRVRALP